jgi:hypothetical protein
MFTTQLIRMTTLAVVLGLVLIGQAAAGVRPDDRSGTHGSTLSSQGAYPDLVDRYLAAQAARDAAMRPDNRGGPRGEFRATVTRVTAPTSSVDFQWDDAGIGAALLAGLLLAGGSGIALARWGVRKSSPARGV